MSGGSWLNHGTDSIGTTPGYMGPWEKLQLGWLDYKVVPFGTDTTVKLGPADLATQERLGQALVVPLPDAHRHDRSTTRPHSGKARVVERFGDNLNSTLTRTVDLTGAKTSASISAWVQGNIEQDYDYLYGEVSTDNGATLDAGRRRRSTVTSAWTQKSWDLSAYKGQTVQFRFRVRHRRRRARARPFLDDIAVTTDGVAGPVDDVESGAGALDRQGRLHRHRRHHVQAGAGLLPRREPRLQRLRRRRCKTGPYNFGWGNTRPDWVERFPYQNGMLVWFANGEYGDNNTSPTPVAARCSRSTPARRRSC